MIDWDQTFVLCEAYDEAEELSEEEEYPVGKWHLVYQAEQDVTYVIYEFVEEEEPGDKPPVEEEDITDDEEIVEGDGEEDEE